MEWTPPGGFYRSVPIRPRWDGPGWGTVLLAGVVVAAMGWMLLTERARGNAPAVGAAAEEPAAVVPGTGGGAVRRTEERRVAVAWERKAGPEKDARDGAGSRWAEPVLERAETAPRRAAPRKAEPRRAAPRVAGPERKAKRARYPAKPVEAVKRKKHREPARAGRPAAPARGAGRPAKAVRGPGGGVLSGFAGHECEKQMAGTGPFCSLVADRVFSAGQAHGGR